MKRNQLLRIAIWIRFKRLMKIREGEEVPIWMQWLSCILFPSRFAFMLSRGIFDNKRQIWTIYRIKYSDDFFLYMSENGLPLDSYFKIVRRDNGTVSIEKVAKQEFSSTDVHTMMELLIQGIQETGELPADPFRIINVIIMNYRRKLNQNN